MTNVECRIKEINPILKKPEKSDFNHSSFVNRHSTFPGWVNKYIGLPFDQANCWQLVCRVYQEQFGIELPFLDNEYVSPMDRKNIKALYDRELLRTWRRVNPPVAGDAIVLRVSGQPWHVGLVVAANHMLHTQKGLEAVIEKYTGPIWQHRIIGFYRYVK